MDASHQQPKLYITGLYSGPSPSAGLGIAKSIKLAFPDLHLVGIDYCDSSSGLHAAVFDEVMLYPSWDLLDQELHTQEIEDLISQGHLISSLDVEIHWLRGKIPDDQNLIMPSSRALSLTAKPNVNFVSDLLISRAAYVTGELSDEEIHDFCRQHSWRIWIKGPHHGASYVQNWSQLDRARQGLLAHYPRAALSYQAHVRGNEESICFCAVGGEVIDAIHMKKRVVTPTGKTWAGKIANVSPKLLEPLRGIVKALDWTGGAEIELIRDPDDNFWFVEWNPRFPAWIHGATLAGRNLPGQLYGAVTGRPWLQLQSTSSDEFTRVVTEIAVKKSLPLPLPKQPSHGDVVTVGKYGASLESLSALEQLTTAADAPSTDIYETDEAPTLWQDIQEAFDSNQATPFRHLLHNHAAQTFLELKNLTESIPDGLLRPAYSFKTSPDTDYLDLAMTAGMRAEAISMLEVLRAVSHGWNVDEIILNGPAKWWPLGIHAHPGLRAVFCDSLEELRLLLQSSRHDKLWGIRLRVPGFKSRFGVDVYQQDIFQETVRLVRSMPQDIEFGIHFHLGSSLIGTGHWKDALGSSLYIAKCISDLAQRKINVVDLGGGYHPRDLFRYPWQNIVGFIKAELPEIDEVIIEPGRALTQETMAMVTSVLDIRRNKTEITEIVVDTCISDLPLANAYPHRFYLQQDDDIRRIRPGRTRVFGRICMEDDILSEGLAFPETLNIGDRILIGDAGAYERSMSYEFGRGGY